MSMVFSVTVEEYNSIFKVVAMCFFKKIKNHKEPMQSIFLDYALNNYLLPSQITVSYQDTA